MRSNELNLCGVARSDRDEAAGLAGVFAYLSAWLLVWLSTWLAAWRATSGLWTRFVRTNVRLSCPPDTLRTLPGHANMAFLIEKRRLDVRRTKSPACRDVRSRVTLGTASRDVPSRVSPGVTRRDTRRLAIDTQRLVADTQGLAGDMHQLAGQQFAYRRNGVREIFPSINSMTVTIEPINTFGVTVTFGRYEQVPFETPKMSAPRFTVITTCHNHGYHIERTICSVLDQGYDDTQYIVVDRGSDDGTNQVAAIYEDQLTLIGAPGASVVQAINRGLAIAEGEYVVFADDLLMPGALPEADQMFKRTEADWLVGQCVRVNEDDFATDKIPATDPPSFQAMLMHDSPSLPMFGTALRRELIDSSGPFDDRLGHAYGYEYWCRLMSRGIRPRVMGATIGGYRDADPRGAKMVVAQGMEMIDVARRYGRFLPIRQQVELWRNCDRRQRIYALAEAELAPVTARRKLVQQIVRRPWWIMHDHVRQTLVKGVTHPLPLEEREAA